MSISIETVINRGFTAWTKNLKISIPFILYVILIGIIWVVFTVLFMVSIIPSLSQLSFGPNMGQEQLTELVTVLTPYAALFAVGVVIITLVSMLIQAFFISGAIGMAKDAALTGRTSYEEIVNSGKTHAINYFLLEILYYLIILVGIVFVIPGILQTGDLTNPDALMQNLPLLGAGFAAWFIYGIVVSIILSVTYYALVVDKLGPIESLKTGVKFFMNNKAAVVILWLVTIVIVAVFNLASALFSPFETLSAIWSVVSTVVSIAVIPAIITVWWTFLYMGKTGWDIKDPDTGELLQTGDENQQTMD